MSKAQYFGRGCTLVVLGSFVSLFTWLSNRDGGGLFFALCIAVATLYPGFTQIGMAILKEDE